MKPAPFTYHRPHDLGEALGLLAEFGDDAKVLAGGQSLVPLLALRLASPPHVVDIGRIDMLRHIDATDPTLLSIGANVTQRVAEFDEHTQRDVPLLAEALTLIAHPAIRNRGTVCGSITHADPAAELPAVALALDATLVARSSRGSRRICAADFFLSYLETGLEADEVLTAIELPVAAPRSGASFREISRRHGDFAIAGVAASLTIDGAGRIADARIALSGVGSTPVRAAAGEALLRGVDPTDEAFAAAAHDATAPLDPPDDIHATSAYRRHVAGVLVQRALRSAHARAMEGIDEQ